MSARGVALAVAAVTLVAIATPVAARADADPPSDFLLSQYTYVPFFGGRPSKESTQYLADVVKAANSSGYTIKVAVIGTQADLGGVFSLYGKPRKYAPFLGRELAFQYRGRLLTAMPQGFGFYWRGHPTQREQRIVDSVQIQPGVDGLVQSSADAVKKLAAADGHPINVQKPGGGGGSSNGTRIIIAVAGGLILAAILVVPVLLRRRRRATA